MINRELLVPYRSHTLKECDEVIRQAGGVDRTPRKLIVKDDLGEIHQSWIEACMYEAKKPLNDYEQGFLVSAYDHLVNRGFLTENEAKVLERIYVQKV